MDTAEFQKLVTEAGVQALNRPPALPQSPQAARIARLGDPRAIARRIDHIRTLADLGRIVRAGATRISAGAQILEAAH